MYQILENLNKTSGISGSMIVGRDGIVIAADIEAKAEEEAVGALAASITTNIQKSLERLQSSPLAQVTVEADNGKMFFTDAGMGILVVMAARDVNIGLIRLEIRNAVNKLKQQESVAGK
jgi:predicted regulator of Ras-like GTPase activity (Roadblock/LC7/MglB family)